MPMASIFEIAGELTAIQKALECGIEAHTGDDPDNSPELADKRLDELIERELSTTQALKAKLDGYCNLMADLEWRAVQASNEISRLKNMKSGFEGLAKRLRENLLFVLTRLELEKVETPLHRVSLAKSPLSVDVDEFADIPEEFLRVKSEVDKIAIKDALKAGRELPFARWAPEKFSLRIK